MRFIAFVPNSKRRLYASHTKSTPADLDGGAGNQPGAQRLPLSYGMPSALGAMLFLEVKARMIIEAMNGIML